MPKTRDILLSRKKAARFLDISVRTVDRWTRENFVPHIRLRGRVLYSKRKLLEWLEGYEIAGKDWEAEFSKMSIFLLGTQAKRRLRIKKRIRKLNLEITDLRDREEELGEKEVIIRNMKALNKLVGLFDEELKLIYKEATEVFEELHIKKWQLRDYEKEEEEEEEEEWLYISDRALNKKWAKLERIEMMEERGLIHKKERLNR